MVYSIKNEVSNFKLCATTPCIKKFFFGEGGSGGKGGGRGQLNTGQRQFSSVHRNMLSHALQAGKNDEISRLVSRLGLLPVLINGKRSIFQMAVRVKQILTFKPFE